MRIMQVTREADPLAVPVRLSAAWRPSTVVLEELPPVFTGGWVGYTGYDTVRYVFPGARRLQRACASTSRCHAALQGIAAHTGLPGDCEESAWSSVACRELAKHASARGTDMQRREVTACLKCRQAAMGGGASGWGLPARSAPGPVQ